MPAKRTFAGFFIWYAISNMIVVLHNIRSLHNVGSIFRTADAAGCEKIYLCGYTPAPYDEFGLPRGPLAKTALGAEKYLAWEKRGSTAKVLDELKEQGYRVYAVEQGKGSVRADRVRLSEKEWQRAALVVGNEIKGLSPGVLKRSHKLLELPMRGKKESLNVSVAFGIVAYSLSEKL
jgi:23S rRNA (guanosine2251-2'-O)-methyltransferase